MPATSFKTLDADFVTIRKLTTALEDYADLLAGTTSVDGLEARVVSTALESIDPDFDIKEGSQITLRAIKEAIVKGTKAAIELLKRLWEIMHSYYVKFTGSIRQVRRKQLSISRQLARLGSKNTNERLVISGIQRLSVNGKFVGMDTEALDNVRDVTRYILNTYPKSVVKLARDTSRGFLNALDRTDENTTVREITEECIGIYLDKLETSFISPPGDTAVAANEGPESKSGLSRSVVLPDNIAFVYVDPDKVRTSMSDFSSVDKLVNESLTMEFTTLQLNLADRSEREIDAPSITDLNELLNTISQILTLSEKAEAGRRDFESVRGVVNDAIRQISESESKVALKVLFLLGEISKKLAEPMGFYTHWLAITLNVWLTFIGHCVKHYEEKGF